MKLISLNIWGGKLYTPLMQFLREQKESTDIFCFQEATECEKTVVRADGYRTNILGVIRSELNEFYCYFAPLVHNSTGNPPGTHAPQAIGQAMCIRRDITYNDYGERFVYRGRNDFLPPNLSTIPRLIQYCTIDVDGVPCVVINFHGIHGDGKQDTENRIQQSKNIVSFLKFVQHPVIFCGDYNLAPDTKSLAILEVGMVNLIKKNGVTSTRSHHYEKPMRFADYMLLSPQIQVQSFSVSDVEVSDHLPMILDFALPSRL